MQSHINPLTTFKKYRPLGISGFQMFYGKVVSNKDKRLLGRIKCQIPDLLPWNTKKKLPWIFPLYPAGLGQGPLTSYFVTPEEDSNVAIITPSESIYHMYYVWHVNDRLNRMQDFHSEYPQRYGWQDSLENKKIVNKDKEINAIEERWSDGSLSVRDSKNERKLFMDFNGTDVIIDRKEQSLEIRFANQYLNISKEGIILRGEKIVIDSDSFVLTARKGVLFDTDYVVTHGKFVQKDDDEVIKSPKI